MTFIFRTYPSFSPCQVLSIHPENKNAVYQLQTLHEQGLSEKAIIFNYPDKGWNFSTVKKVCNWVDHTSSAILHKTSSGRPATTSACTVCHSKTIFPLV